VDQHILIEKQEYRRHGVRRLFQGEEAGAGAGSTSDDREDSCCDFITTPQL
jgi:hypothetical protein